MYNKVKPVSSESQIFKQIQELPIIDFPVEQNGSMFQSNLKVNVKQKAFFESASGKNIARMMIKVNAQSLGNITVNFKDVLLENGAYCLVYTQDHQIVAGPIYQKSISNNQFTIMNIPASELILEVIYNDKKDFTMLLDEVSFKSLINLNQVKKKKQQEQFLTSACDDYGVASYVDNILFLNPFRYYLNGDSLWYPCDIYNPTNYYSSVQEGCNWLGAANNDIWNYNTLYSANDIKYINNNSKRSSCVIMISDHCELDSVMPTNKRFVGKNGILINLPNLDCDASFIITSFHEFGSLGKDTLETQYGEDNSMVRFNWYYKYGTPEHLKNISCMLDTNNFNLWRSQMNFDEVIDYKGLELVAYNIGLEGTDFILLKMKCKPFYKEHHLGWTTQMNFDFYQHNVTEFITKDVSDRMTTLGSRGGHIPKQYFSNHKVNGRRIDGFFLTDEQTKSNFSGWSGSALTMNDYYDVNHEVMLGVNNYSAGMGEYSLYGITPGQTRFNKILNDSLLFNTLSADKRIWTYYQDNNLVSSINNTTSYYGLYDDEFKTNLLYTFTEDIYWYPSMENKQKCPSPVSPSNPCDFDINDYVDVNQVGDSICVIINEIPANKFPDSTNIPKGFRIYHNFGEQNTIHWESFQDDVDIDLPFTFCLSKCEQLDLLSIGRDGIDIGIDFYDGDGNVYNNVGCDTASIFIEFPTFCDLFSVDIKKIDSTSECCTYEIELTIDYDLESLQDCAVNPNIIKLLDSLYFYSSVEDEYINIHDIEDVDFDTTNGVVTFEYTPCVSPVPNNTTFKFFVSNDRMLCEIDSIDIPFCTCSCPESSEDWLTVSVNRGEDPCSEDQCTVTVNIEIPSLEGQCYQQYKIEGDPALKALTPNGEIQFVPSCIYRGEAKDIIITLFVDGPFSDSCQITKSIYCPLVDEKNICTPDCPEVEWKDSTLTMQVNGCTDCEVKIDYKFREATCFEPARQDIQIYKLEIFSSNPSIPDACALCTIDIKNLYQRALWKIIHKNDMNFKPNEETFPTGGWCDTTWRIVQNSCWTQIPLGQHGTIANPTPDFALVPCDESECCVVGIKVCRFGEHAPVTITGLTDWDDTDSCELYSKSYYDPHTTIEGDPPFEVWVYHCCSYSQCNSTCEDWLNDIDVTNYTGNKILLENENILEFDEIFSKFIVDFKKIQIIINSNKEFELTNISIYNLLGQEIYYNKFSIQNGMNVIDINSSNLKNGVYFIQVNLAGQKLLNHKILIVR